VPIEGSLLIYRKHIQKASVHKNNFLIKINYGLEFESCVIPSQVLTCSTPVFPTGLGGGRVPVTGPKVREGLTLRPGVTGKSTQRHKLQNHPICGDGN
jgi:hypothetical protein